MPARSTLTCFRPFDTLSGITAGPSFGRTDNLQRMIGTFSHQLKRGWDQRAVGFRSSLPNPGDIICRTARLDSHIIRLRLN